MTLELAYVTATHHFHRCSVKLAYLIGWRHWVPSPMSTSPDSRLVIGQLNLTVRVLLNTVIQCAAIFSA
jgi:hypothetical protein